MAKERRFQATEVKPTSPAKNVVYGIIIMLGVAAIIVVTFAGGPLPQS